MPKILSADNPEPERRTRPARGASLFVREKALVDMTDHADRGAETGTEIMGLMLGKLYCDDWGEYAIVEQSVTAKLESDAVSVRFSEEAFEELFDNLDASEWKNVVGWYHSHPGFGCYLSETDINTHVGIFGDGKGFAIVIDPSDGTVKTFTCSGREQKDVRMVVME